MGGPADLRRPEVKRRIPAGSRLRAMKRRIPVGSPLQILLLACSFALAGYAAVRLLAGDWLGVTLWFVGAALLHDLVLLPLYSAADRALVRGCAAVGRRERLLYVRVPAALSLLLLLIWAPLITGAVDRSYRLAAGQSTDGYLARWLLMTALLFAGSAAVLALRLRRAAKHRPPAAH
ncbi:hypothetical protein ACQEV4_19205 [Streptomyces shenzhenensis]|uniref:hypothetical protein n=1 Tax=Streptomyces shenzhenensis TaxID=943815 RepID=UPI003D8BDD03